MILPADARTYVVIGTVNVQIPIPPGHRIVGFVNGRPPLLFPLPPDAGELEIAGVEWDTLSPEAIDALPAVLVVVSRADAADLAAMSQQNADDVHADVVCDWARGTSAGFA